MLSFVGQYKNVNDLAERDLDFEGDTTLVCKEKCWVDDQYRKWEDDFYPGGKWRPLDTMGDAVDDLADILY